MPVYPGQSVENVARSGKNRLCLKCNSEMLNTHEEMVEAFSENLEQSCNAPIVFDRLPLVGLIVEYFHKLAQPKEDRETVYDKKVGDSTLAIRAVSDNTAGDKTLGERTSPPRSCGESISGEST